MRRAADRASFPGWRRRLTVRLGAGAGLVAAGLAGIVLLGSVPQDTAALRAAAAGSVSLRGPVVEMAGNSTEATTRTLRAQGWAVPADLPVDLHIAGATVHTDGGAEVLEGEIAGGAGVAPLFQGRGALEAEMVPAHAEGVQCG
ncbi:MAG: hypothetical protein LPK38_01190, partial [Actinomycetes bacterium]|nr:hypothetical protein [Actinomycetes bacterium]MDX5379927.1 hypothetical protein [Actinomycetes bacterium]MDX5449639.1 hypothetical protein [Actinomycetes bacterium]